jgi:hypothetical protein
MDELLLIYLSYPGMDMTEIRVSPQNTVQSLEAHLPDSQPHSFFLDDFELSPAFSLAFSGAYNYCVIVALPSSVPPKPPPPPPKKSRNESAPKQVSDRLTDQFFSHVEGTTSSYRKLVNRFLHMGGRGAKRKKPEPKKTVIPDSPE